MATRSPRSFLLGEIAVELEYVTRDQLAHAIQIQRSATKQPRLGDLLVQLGYLVKSQLSYLRDQQAGRLAAPDALHGRPYNESLLGKLVVRLGYCREESVHTVVRDLALAEGEGGTARLGEALVERGFLTPYQLHRVLSTQNKRVLHCPNCAKRFNILAYQPGHRLRCYYCETFLVRPKDPAAIGFDEEFFFDHERAEDVRLLGQLGLRNGFFQRNQLEEALRVQEAEGEARTIGEILIELGSLDRAGLERLLEMQGTWRHETDRQRIAAMRDARFGEVGAAQGLLEASIVEEALAIQAKERAPSPRRIGRILFEEGKLTEAQVRDILAIQKISIAACPSCNGRYNVRADARAVCPRCDHALDGAPTAGIDVDGDLVRATSSEALSVIDLDSVAQAGDAGADPPPIVGDRLSSTRRTFRRFHETERMREMKREEARERTGSHAAGSEASGSRASGSRLVPLETARRQKTVILGRRLSRRTFWSAALALSLAVAALASMVLTGSGPFQRVPESLARAPRASEDSLKDAPALEEGTRIEVWGTVPAGENVTGVLREIVEEKEVQAFYLVAVPGRSFWAVDRTGASKDRMGYFVTPDGAGVDRAVRVEGRFTRSGPADIAFPWRATEGYLEIACWLPQRPAELPAPGERVRVVSASGP